MRPRPALVAVAAVAVVLGACAAPSAGPEPIAPAVPTVSPSVRRSGPDPTQPTTETPTPTQTPTREASAVRDPALDDDLIRAAWANDVDAARDLIERGADVNAKDATEQSAYLIATSEGFSELLRLTLDHGADVASLDSYRGTGLIRAAERGHADIVGELIQRGVDIDHVNRLGWTGLHEALVFAERAGGEARGDERDYVDTVRVLVAAGGDVTLRSRRDDRSPLELARESGLDAQAELIDAATSQGRVSRAEANRRLLDAAAGDDADAAALALRGGAELEARNDRGQTPLLVAAAADSTQVARLLTYLGADPDAVDDRSDTPWLVTGVTGSVQMLEILLPADPDLTATNRFGGLSPIPAAERGHVDYLRRVVRTEVDLDHVNDLGWTALLEAVILGDGGERHQQVVKILLDAGADPAIPDADGVTALQHAERRGYDEIAELLR